jgi:hypothetical protein
VDVGRFLKEEGAAAGLDGTKYGDVKDVDGRYVDESGQSMSQSIQAKRA